LAAVASCGLHGCPGLAVLVHRVRPDGCCQCAYTCLAGSRACADRIPTAVLRADQSARDRRGRGRRGRGGPASRRGRLRRLHRNRFFHQSPHPEPGLSASNKLSRTWHSLGITGLLLVLAGCSAPKEARTPPPPAPVSSINVLQPAAAT